MAPRTRDRRPSTVAAHGLRAAVLMGATLWLNRRLIRRWLANPDLAGLAEAVHHLAAAHGRMDDTMDRRLRSLEESAARAKAEMRFMATVLGEQNGARLRPGRVTQRPSPLTACVEPIHHHVSLLTDARWARRVGEGSVR